jgi:hypothetical protein
MSEPKWVPVSERLPRLDEMDGDGNVLVCWGFGCAWLAIARLDGRQWREEDTSTAEGILPDVTHWMPLPKRPKQDFEESA